VVALRSAELFNPFRLMRELPLPASVTTPGFVTWCADTLAPFAPLHRWFVQTLRAG
jgi:hypothetical protein